MSYNKPSNVGFKRPDIKTPQIKTSTSTASKNNSGMSFLFYLILLLLASFIILLLMFLVQYLRQPCGPPGKMNYW